MTVTVPAGAVSVGDVVAAQSGAVVSRVEFDARFASTVAAGGGLLLDELDATLVAVMPSGVWVVGRSEMSAQVSFRVESSGPRLFVDGTRTSRPLRHVHAVADRVAAALDELSLGDDVPTFAALCFLGARWIGARDQVEGRSVESVLVGPPAAVLARVAAPGPVLVDAPAVLLRRRLSGI